MSLRAMMAAQSQLNSVSGLFFLCLRTMSAESRERFLKDIEAFKDKPFNDSPTNEDAWELLKLLGLAYTEFVAITRRPDLLAALKRSELSQALEEMAKATSPTAEHIAAVDAAAAASPEPSP